MGSNKLVYIASPYAGDVEENVAFAKAACRYAMEQDVTPGGGPPALSANACGPYPGRARGRNPDGDAGCWKPVTNCGCAAAGCHKGCGPNWRRHSGSAFRRGGLRISHRKHRDRAGTAARHGDAS